MHSVIQCRSTKRAFFILYPDLREHPENFFALRVRLCHHLIS